LHHPDELVRIIDVTAAPTRKVSFYADLDEG
jgi:hypothetical protein